MTTKLLRPLHLLIVPLGGFVAASVACGLGVVGSAEDGAGDGGGSSSSGSTSSSGGSTSSSSSGADGESLDDASKPTDAGSDEDEDAKIRPLSPRCDAGLFFCAEAGTCVDRCKTMCGAAQIECVGCKQNGGVAVVVCIPPGGNCTSGPGVVRCPCPSGKNDCPGARQVCSEAGATPQCLGCGEQGSDNLDCKGGKKCDDDGSGNPDDNQTCR